jgi:hypothetical protein
MMIAIFSFCNMLLNVNLIECRQTCWIIGQDTSAPLMNMLVYDYSFCRRASVLNEKDFGCYDSAPIINCMQAASVIMAHY